ncbi:hypothetical protein B0H11DRAFT_2187885 [Mycena galericulata]|nr:hypothetical protein B0H11DRAFT_2187885 [Mycena galericulata]
MRNFAEVIHRTRFAERIESIEGGHTGELVDRSEDVLWSLSDEDERLTLSMNARDRAQFNMDGDTWSRNLICQDGLNWRASLREQPDAGECNFVLNEVGFAACMPRSANLKSTSEERRRGDCARGDAEKPENESGAEILEVHSEMCNFGTSGSALYRWFGIRTPLVLEEHGSEILYKTARRYRTHRALDLCLDSEQRTASEVAQGCNPGEFNTQSKSINITLHWRARFGDHGIQRSQGVLVEDREPKSC